MIKFIQHKSPKYPPRTYENASADATIAFAFDFNTPGERLTQDAVKTQGKLYIGVNPSNHPLKMENIILNAGIIISQLDGNASTFNIAGNGLYTTIKYGYQQRHCDALVYTYLSSLFESLDKKPTLIRSGGQSGFDEAGLKAAVKLGIPALCVCPQGWKFMDQNGTTICDEKQFKNRFNGVLIL